jgi:thiosulfate dehydrogenase [quinone] large subunit
MPLPNHNNEKLAFLLARLAVGISLFGHGVVRLTKAGVFSEWMRERFENSWLPASLVGTFGYVLPWIEFGLGLLLIIGLFTRSALVGGALLMIVLIGGTCMIEDWSAIPSQLIHAGFCALLLVFIDRYNDYSIDRRFLSAGH